MTTILIAPTADPDRVRVTFQYDPTVVELLKLAIPSYGRTWDRATKTWTVGAHWVSELVRYASSYGHEVIDERAARQTPKPRAISNWADATFAAVGADRVEAVHRALTRVLHPDREGGDADLMRELNAARDRRNGRNTRNGRAA